MNNKAKVYLEKIISKLKNEEKLTDYESSFFRARRSYVPPMQKIQHGDILYFNKQFLFSQIGNVFAFIIKYSKKIIIALILKILVG